MDCNWTEKISLLIDGELAPEEAGAVERHAAQCQACQRARGDFLLMRQQISSFHAEPNLVAQRAALKNILREGGAARGQASGWRERLAGVFALPRLSPALMGAAALVLVAVLVGVVMLRKPERVEVASNPKQAGGTNVNAVSTPAPSLEVAKANGTAGVESKELEKATDKVGTKGETRRREGSGDVRVLTASAEKPRRAARLNAEKLREEEASVRRARIVERLHLPVTPKIAVDTAEFAETELASVSTKLAPTDSGTARHVEQAQLLLRAFRNARANGEPSTSDISYEKRRSRELLYHNIVLRREAASKGNIAVASLLDNLEPILIDIANLPDSPAQEDMRSITDRMKKKNIVAMLQVANASRMY
ncbi:MAG: anti-sigma factor family protein [Pyrinomonadaceae bacterium]